MSLPLVLEIHSVFFSLKLVATYGSAFFKAFKEIDDLLGVWNV